MREGQLNTSGVLDGEAILLFVVFMQVGVLLMSSLQGIGV